MNDVIRTFLISGICAALCMYIMENIFIMNVYTFRAMTILIVVSAFHTIVVDLAYKNIRRSDEKI